MIKKEEKLKTTIEMAIDYMKEMHPNGMFGHDIILYEILEEGLL